MKKLVAMSVLVFLFVPVWAQTPVPKVQLLETGSFHGEEIKAQSGEKWLGLYVGPNGSSLITSTLKITRVVDPLSDLDNPGQKTGKKVSVDQSTKPIFLVKNAGMLKAGAVTTAYRGFQTKRHELFDPYVDSLEFKTIRLKLGDQEYRIKTVGKQYPLAGELQGQSGFDARLVLTDGKTTQTLYSIKGSVETKNWYLLWAGDADGDGKLDLYVETSPHYNGWDGRLFLSSQAMPGQLVKEVAKFIRVGC